MAELHCDNCGADFEADESAEETPDALECPECGSDDIAGGD